MEYALLQFQITRQPPDPLRQPFLAGGEAPAQEAVAFGSEGAAGGETQPRLAHEALAEVEAVLDAFDAEEDVHRARRRGDFDAAERSKSRNEKIARGAEARERALHGRLAVGDR